LCGYKISITFAIYIEKNQGGGSVALLRFWDKMKRVFLSLIGNDKSLEKFQTVGKPPPGKRLKLL
jgi:hypothetical protein